MIGDQQDLAHAVCGGLHSLASDGTIRDETVLYLLATEPLRPPTQADLHNFPEPYSDRPEWEPPCVQSDDYLYTS